MHNAIHTICTHLHSKNMDFTDFLLNIFYYIKIIIDLKNGSDVKEIIITDNSLINNNLISNIKQLNNDQLLDIQNQYNANPPKHFIQELENILKINKELKNYYNSFDQLKTGSSFLIRIIEEIDNLNIDRFKINILNLFSGTGTLALELIKNNFNHKNIYSYDINEKLNLINLYSNMICNNINIKDQIFKVDLLHDNINIINANLIVCDIPSNLKNIIHANCSDRIKKIKIRGTKSEPLIIQLITTLLTKNGVAIVIIPDSFLFNDSIQHIDTRKYLIENFNVKKIINFEQYKKSILIFSNSGKTTEIEFTNYSNTLNIKLPYDTIVNNKYSLYHHNYDIIIKPIFTQNASIYDLKTYINIVQNNYISVDDILVSYKFNQLKICTVNKSDTFEYGFITKDSSIITQPFLNYLLYNLLSNNMDTFTKGKIKQFDINLILNTKIKIPDVSTQILITDNIYDNNKLILNYNLKIKNLELIKCKFINTIIQNTPTIKLNSICNIEFKSNLKNTIQINKNSIIAGTVSLTTSEINVSSNIYYLANIANNYDNKCLYYILKYNEPDIQKLANLSNTIQLAKNKLENFQIPNLSEIEHKEILKCEIFDNEISLLTNNINNLKQSNIFTAFL